MRTVVRTLFLRSCLSLIGLSAVLQARELRFDAPATHFTESVPLGNGRLGAMLFGGIAEDRVVLNETGMWSGSPQQADREGASTALPEIRRLLLQGKNVEAEALVNAGFTCVGSGSGQGVGSRVPFGCYQTLGSLRIQDLDANDGSQVSGYKRVLDLQTARFTQDFRRGSISQHREAFVSSPDELLVYRYEASEPGGLNLQIGLSRPERAVVKVLPGNRLLMIGTLNDGRGGKGVSFACLVELRSQGGRVSPHEGGLRVEAAQALEVRVTAATDIQSFAGRHSKDALQAALHDLEAVESLDFATLEKRQTSAYAALFDRCHLDLGTSEATASVAPSPTGLPTGERLRRFAAGAEDADLAALYFDYGRYLLISGSRPDGFPMNLQGLWAQELQTPWNGDWHLNINVQMNYWPAEVCGLGELATPLFALTRSLVAPGEHTARAYYNARGWVAHVITNPWGFTSPGEAASWGATTTGSAWLCQHLWDHFLFTRDRAFLAAYYPVMRGSARFYADMLVEDPASGYLVTAPSNSPENSFLLPSGEKAHLCLGSTADMQILRYLFSSCIEASKALGRDEDFRAELQDKIARLAPSRVASDGRLMEWDKEYREVDPQHRHTAHLWGLYPGFEISPRQSPLLAAAASKSLDVRGDAGTGWGLALKMIMRARLGQGDRAYVLLRSHLKPASVDTLNKQWSGGTYANLFDAHPPFQIDGNLGGCAAIAEMLLQSRVSEIELLPSLPSAWPEGSFRGLVARGGHQISASWSKGTLVSLEILPMMDETIVVLSGAHRVSVQLKAGQRVRFDGDLRPALDDSK